MSRIDQADEPGHREREKGEIESNEGRIEQLSVIRVYRCM